MAPDALETLLEKIRTGAPSPLYLVAGEAVLGEPRAERISQALADRFECQVTVVRRPPSVAPILSDLRTFSLFESGKVVLATETALLADRSAAAQLIDEVAEVVPLASAAGGELVTRERRAASRALQVLHLFGISPDVAAEAAVRELPDWVFQGGETGGRGRRKSRKKKEVEELRAGLVELLDRASSSGLVGWAEGDAADLAAMLREGLPERHALVLCESSVAEDHPVCAQLRTSGHLVDVGHVSTDRRGGYKGLDAVAAELAKETGATLDQGALDELARRTLRKSQVRGHWEEIDLESTARFAAEYRKLATLHGSGSIGVELVRGSVEDRGEEDVWQIFDAVGSGRADEALVRLRRMLWSAEDPTGVRLRFFTLLADFCRQLVAVQGLVAVHGLQRSERSFNRFKAHAAPLLQGPLPDGSESPLRSLHPFRLFKVYGAAGRLRADLSLLPWRVLETELRLKGESADQDTALSELLIAVATGRGLESPPLARRKSIA